MAPRKPTPKSSPKPMSKPAAKPASKPAAKAKLTVWPDAHAHDHAHHHHDHAHADCCGHHGTNSPLACLCACCPIAKIVFTRTYWAAAVVAFLIIFITDWFLHARFLAADYAATSAIWRADAEVRPSLILITQIITALSYAALILGMDHAKRWWGSFSSGVLVAVPVAMCAMSGYIMLPFASAYIPTVWAIASLLQGGLTGLVICIALHISRAPGNADCCPPKPTLH